MTRPAGTAELGALGAITGSYLAVRTGRAAHLDAPLQRRLTTRHTPRADRVVGVMTDLGSVYALAGVTSALAVTGRRTAALDVAVAGTGAWVAAQAAKPLLHRPRPYELATDAATRVVAVPAGSSWPSGHAALAAAMADSIGARAGAGTRVVLSLATGAIGISRCYVGVHHPTDIVAGVGVGIVASRIARRLTARVTARLTTR